MYPCNTILPQQPRTVIPDNGRPHVTIPERVAPCATIPVRGKRPVTHLDHDRPPIYRTLVRGRWLAPVSATPVYRPFTVWIPARCATGHLLQTRMAARGLPRPNRAIEILFFAISTARKLVLLLYFKKRLSQKLNYLHLDTTRRLYSWLHPYLSPRNGEKKEEEEKKTIFIST